MAITLQADALTGATAVKVIREAGDVVPLSYVPKFLTIAGNEYPVTNITGDPATALTFDVLLGSATAEPHTAGDAIVFASFPALGDLDLAVPNPFPVDAPITGKDARVYFYDPTQSAYVEIEIIKWNLKCMAETADFTSSLSGGNRESVLGNTSKEGTMSVAFPNGKPHPLFMNGNGDFRGVHILCVLYVGDGSGYWRSVTEPRSGRSGNIVISEFEQNCDVQDTTLIIPDIPFKVSGSLQWVNL